VLDLPHQARDAHPLSIIQGDTTLVAVKIRLKRMGKIRTPYYRVVVVDSRKKRDGRVIEQIGKYHPKEEPSVIEVTSDRAQYWLGVGAQPSEAVAALLKVTGDWQKFKGLPGTEGTLRTKEAKRPKADIFNEALKESGGEPHAEAVTSKRAAKKAAPATAPATATADVPSDIAVPAAETPEGATAEAEAAEVKAVDAEQQTDAPADNKPSQA
jgi:small subunit ribosomal protein S16